jgi:hypothetical protein
VFFSGVLGRWSNYGRRGNYSPRRHYFGSLEVPMVSSRILGYERIANARTLISQNTAFFTPKGAGAGRQIP